MRIAIILLCMLAAIGACTSAGLGNRTSFANADQSWNKWESDNFTLISDITPERAEVFLTELEDFRGFVRSVLGAVDGTRPRRRDRSNRCAGNIFGYAQRGPGYRDNGGGCTGYWPECRFSCFV